MGLQYTREDTQETVTNTDGTTSTKTVTTLKENPPAEWNSGFNRRRNGLKTGARNYFQIPLYHDIMTSGKCFPPGTEFEIFLHRNKDEFVFLQPVQYFTNKSFSKSLTFCFVSILVIQ